MRRVLRRGAPLLILMVQGASFGMDERASAPPVDGLDGSHQHHEFRMQRCSTGITDTITAAELSDG